MTAAEIVKDKSVVFVCPSQALEGAHLGEKIDSYDVVVRVNREWNISQAQVMDLGKRTDVLYHLLQVDIAQNSKSFEEAIGKVGHIVSVYPKETPKVEAFEKINKGRISFEAVPALVRANVRRQVRRSPNAGAIALTHLLTLPLKSLHILGMHFYEYGYYEGYGGNKSGSHAFPGNVSAGGHDQPSHKLYVKRLVEGDERVTVDELMEKILKEAGTAAPVRRHARHAPVKPRPRLQKIVNTPLPVHPLKHWTEERMMREAKTDETEVLVALKPMLTSAGFVHRNEEFFADPKRAAFLIHKKKAKRKV